MKTTYDLSDALMAAAMKTGCAATKAATIVHALEQLVRTAKLAKLRKLRGAMPDFDLDTPRIARFRSLRSTSILD